MTTTGLFAQMEPGRRGEILDAALSVFSERGFDGGSMREIASRVGVTEPALYRHFAGKEDLFLALMRVLAHRLVDTSLVLIRDFSAHDLEARLGSVLRDRRETIISLGPALRLLLTTMLRHPEYLDEYRRVMVDPLRRALTAKVEELDRELGHTGTPEERAARVRSLIALFVGYLTTSFVLDDEDDERIGEAAVRLMGWRE